MGRSLIKDTRGQVRSLVVAIADEAGVVSALAFLEGNIAISRYCFKERGAIVFGVGWRAIAKPDDEC